jgi:hypothetical protein
MYCFSDNNNNNNNVIVAAVRTKGKAIPIPTWTGPEGCRRLGLPDFKTIGKRMRHGCRPYALPAFTLQEILLVLISLGG